MKTIGVLLAICLISPVVAEDVINCTTQDHLQSVINKVGSGGTIRLIEGIYKGTVVIDKPLNIVGVGAGRTIVDGDNKGTVFAIGKTNPDIDVRLSGMTIRGGSGKYGGGINNSARLVVEDSTITGNSADSGAGIFNFKDTAKLTVNRVDIKGNHASHDGAGIYNSGATLVIDGGLITENEGEVGGGVLNDVGTLIMKSGTITKNIAKQRGGGVANIGEIDIRGGNVVDNVGGNFYDPR
jgi:hypothetical protein